MGIGPAGEGTVRLQGVDRSFKERPVIRGLTFEAGPGSVLALEGANGSGKTTALRMIAGTLAADAGSIDVCGAAPGRGASGFVPAGDRGLYWRLTVRENLRFFARLGAARAKVPRGNGDEAIAGAAEVLGLSPLLDKRVESCSTGQRRRVMMARAAIADPPVLLIDEPYEGLDEEAVGRVEGLVAGWAKDGGVVVWAAPSASHGPPAGDTICLDSKPENP